MRRLAIGVTSAILTFAAFTNVASADKPVVTTFIAVLGRDAARFAAEAAGPEARNAARPASTTGRRPKRSDTGP